MTCQCNSSFPPFTECPPGTYGPDCALFCIHRMCLGDDDRDICYNKTGACIEGCMDGFTKIDCTERKYCQLYFLLVLTIWCSAYLYI